MAVYNTQDANDAIIFTIQRDRMLADKSFLLKDAEIINTENYDINKKQGAYERLIKYLSHLPKWDEELIAYLGSKFTELKVQE